MQRLRCSESKCLFSPTCSIHIRDLEFSYGRGYSDLVGERSEGQLCVTLCWFDGGGGKLLLGPLVFA